MPPTPGTCAWPPKLSFRAHFASHARHFAGERVELVHHRVDGVFQLENFALHVHRDFARQVAARHGRRHFGDVAHLRRQVSGHRVHGVGKVLPRSRHARHDRLSAELSVRADFARHARHFRRERSQLVHHRVDGFLQLQNFAADVHRNLARKVAARHGGRDFCDVAHLASQVAGHRVDGIGEVLPRARHAGHLRLTAELSVGSHFARHARHFRSENAELLNHRVHDRGRAQKFAFKRPPIDVQPHGLRQIALRHGGDRARHFRRRAQQVIDQRVDRNFHLAPRALGLMKTHSLSRSPFLSDHLSDALQLLRHLLVGGDDVVEGVGDLPASPVHDPGSRTEKSPSRMVCRLARITLMLAAASSVPAAVWPFFLHFCQRLRLYRCGSCCFGRVSSLHTSSPN